eukprot:m.441199 g.441199  ORF g.441199 m.441199 type:complete len:50 (+) comp21467_c0_seq9:547-696(+)
MSTACAGPGASAEFHESPTCTICLDEPQMYENVLGQPIIANVKCASNSL